MLQTDREQFIWQTIVGKEMLLAQNCTTDWHCSYNGIEQNVDLYSGSYCWDSARDLSQYVNEIECKEKSVLEIGTGHGIPLLSAYYGGAKLIVAADLNCQTLENYFLWNIAIAIGREHFSTLPNITADISSASNLSFLALDKYSTERISLFCAPSMKIKVKCQYDSSNFQKILENLKTINIISSYDKEQTDSSSSDEELDDESQYFQYKAKLSSNINDVHPLTKSLILGLLQGSKNKEINKIINSAIDKSILNNDLTIDLLIYSLSLNKHLEYIVQFLEQAIMKIDDSFRYLCFQLGATLGSIVTSTYLSILLNWSNNQGISAKDSGAKYTELIFFLNLFLNVYLLNTQQPKTVGSFWVSLSRSLIRCKCVLDDETINSLEYNNSKKLFQNFNKLLSNDYSHESRENKVFDKSNKTSKGSNLIFASENLKFTNRELLNEARDKYHLIEKLSLKTGEKFKISLTNNQKEADYNMDNLTIKKSIKYVNDSFQFNSYTKKEYGQMQLNNINHNYESNLYTKDSQKLNYTKNTFKNNDIQSKETTCDKFICNFCNKMFNFASENKLKNGTNSTNIGSSELLSKKNKEISSGKKNIDSESRFKSRSLNSQEKIDRESSEELNTTPYSVKRDRQISRHISDDRKSKKYSVNDTFSEINDSNDFNMEDIDNSFDGSFNLNSYIHDIINSMIDANTISTSISINKIIKNVFDWLQSSGVIILTKEEDTRCLIETVIFSYIYKVDDYDRVKIFAHDWTNVKTIAPQNFDIVLGSSVVYESSQFDVVLSTIMNSLATDGMAIVSGRKIEFTSDGGVLPFHSYCAQRFTNENISSEVQMGLHSDKCDDKSMSRTILSIRKNI